MKWKVSSRVYLGEGGLLEHVMYVHCMGMSCFGCLRFGCMRVCVWNAWVDLNM